MRVNTNVSMTGAWTAASRSQVSEAASRLSSGHRVTDAKDDGSGVVISDAIKAQAAEAAKALREGDAGRGGIPDAQPAIRDANIAAETTGLIRAAVLSDAQQAIFAQANSTPARVLALVR